MLTVLLSGIHLDARDALTVGNVSVRRLSAAEQGSIFVQQGGVASLILNSTELAHIVLTLAASGPRTEQRLRSGEQVQSLLAAFQLHGFDIAGRYVAELPDPPWVHSGVLHYPLVLPKKPRQSAPLTIEGLQAVTTTAKRVERYNVSEPASASDLALHRFVTGLARDSYADRVLDFTIALEALLLPHDRNARRGDLAYRFRVHGAHYFSQSADERRLIAEQLTDIYEVRSRLVHGAKYPDRGKIRATHDIACDLARRGLLRAVQEGFPTAKTFNDMVLLP